MTASPCDRPPGGRTSRKLQGKRAIIAAIAAAGLAAGSMGAVAAGGMYHHSHETGVVADDGMYHHS